MRLLVFLALCLILYYLIRCYVGERSEGRGYRERAGRRQGKGRAGPDEKPQAITDQLVKDPVCGVYTPKRDAYPLIWEGKPYYFCSKECRDRFRRSRSRPPSS